MPNESLRVPVWCPVCGMTMKGKSTSTWYDHHCCVSCFIQFVEGREQRWKDGWRPSKEDVDSYVDKLTSS